MKLTSEFKRSGCAMRYQLPFERPLHNRLWLLILFFTSAAAYLLIFRLVMWVLYSELEQVLITAPTWAYLLVAVLGALYFTLFSLLPARPQALTGGRVPAARAAAAGARAGALSAVACAMSFAILAVAYYFDLVSAQPSAVFLVLEFLIAPLVLALEAATIALPGALVWGVFALGMTSVIKSKLSVASEPPATRN